jgi:hypothetical protein
VGLCGEGSFLGHGIKAPTKELPRVAELAQVSQCVVYLSKPHVIFGYVENAYHLKLKSH